MVLAVLAGVCSAANWTGTYTFSGVGLGIGRTTTPFTASIDISGSSLQGTGTDNLGGFKLSGSTATFTKTYNNPTCDVINYVVASRTSTTLSGNYNFKRCSTASYKSKNPFLGLFAPSFQDGSGTFTMSCTDC